MRWILYREFYSTQWKSQRNLKVRVPHELTWNRSFRLFDLLWSILLIPESFYSWATASRPELCPAAVLELRLVQNRHKIINPPNLLQSQPIRARFHAKPWNSRRSLSNHLSDMSTRLVIEVAIPEHRTFFVAFCCVWLFRFWFRIHWV